jgi:hypothetical protein
MANLPSAERVVQSYLAWIPVSADLVSFAANEEKRGFRFRDPQVAVIGKLGLGKVKRQLLLDSARLISDFVNTQDDPEGVLRFTRRYGILQRGEQEYFEEVDDVGDQFCVLCADWLDRQKEFRDQWNKKGKADEETALVFAKQINPTSRFGRAVKTYVVPAKNGAFQLELRPDDLLGAVWLALLGFSGRTRKCDNPTCSSPYFIAARRDQKYCTEICSRLVANRTWWAKRGAQWRAKRMKGRKSE